MKKISGQIGKTLKVLFLMCFSATFAMAQNCECNEFIYLNDSRSPAVHKFQINSDGTLTEIFNSGGGIWYPGPAASELPDPHGVTMDLAGNIYCRNSSWRY